MRPISGSDLLLAYVAAKECVLQHGYGEELVEARQRVRLGPGAISESDFVRESAWVILNSGMAERTVRTRFGLISTAFLEWRSAREIVEHATECEENAFVYFKNRAKITAISRSAELVHERGIWTIREALEDDPISLLRELPFIGPITVFHLLKNLGVDRPKPDRHLSRIAGSMGYDDAQKLCQCVAEESGDPVSVVDSTFWRFATIDPNYVNALPHARRGAPT